MSALTGQIATAERHSPDVATCVGNPTFRKNRKVESCLVAGTTQGHTTHAEHVSDMTEREVVFAPRVHGPRALLPLARFYDQREADLLAHHTIWIRFGLSSAKARAAWLTTSLYLVACAKMRARAGERGN